MSNITLTWDADGSIKSFSVYRAEQSLDLNNLPTPIATGIKDKTYIDNNVVDDKTYFYLVASLKDVQQKLSDEVECIASISDPNFNSVLTLLHFNESLVSSTKENLAFELKGSAMLSTAVAKFGKSSLYTQSGTVNYAISTITSNLNFKANDALTVEFFFKKIDTSGNASMLQIRDVGSENRISFFARDTNAPKFAVFSSKTGTFLDASAKTTVTVGEDSDWHHYAYTQDGTTARLFIDGSLVASSTSQLTGFTNSRLYIGQNSLDAESYNGYIDELRITKGVARYTNDFTVPSAQFPNH